MSREKTSAEASGAKKMARVQSRNLPVPFWRMPSASPAFTIPSHSALVRASCTTHTPAQACSTRGDSVELSDSPSSAAERVERTASVGGIVAVAQTKAQGIKRVYLATQPACVESSFSQTHMTDQAQLHAAALGEVRIARSCMQVQRLLLTLRAQGFCAQQLQ